MRSKVATKVFSKTSQQTKDDVNKYADYLKSQSEKFTPNFYIKTAYYTIEINYNKYYSFVFYRYVVNNEIFDVQKVELKYDLDNKTYFVDENNFTHYIENFNSYV